MSESKLDNITLSASLKYAVLPGIIPRINELWRTGFATIAALMAQIFMNIGLLPVGHTYVLPQNYGRFGVFQVVMAARDNLVFSRKHIDQIVIFGLICLGIFSIFAQICAFIMAILIPGAFAQMSLFVTPNPSNDIAFVLLDRIFGVPISTGAGTIGFFGSCVGDATSDCISMRYDGTDSATEIVPVPAIFPWAFHLAMHQMFAFFSYTIAAVSLFILLYFIVAIVLESIQSGTPFGRRFSKLWAPLRLIMAFALIVPISNGLNLAQYGVLYSAKWGSSLATNVWTQFNINLATNGIIDANAMVGTPNAQESLDIIGMLHMATACKYIEETVYPYTDTPAGVSGLDKRIRVYLINARTNQALDVSVDVGPPDYDAARAFSDGGDIVMRFGSLDPAKRGVAGGPTADSYGRYAGYVNPYCGEIVFPAVNENSAGSKLFQQKIYEFIWGILSLSFEPFTTYMWASFTQPNCPLTAAEGYDGYMSVMWFGYYGLQSTAQQMANKQLPSLATSGFTSMVPPQPISETKLEGAVLYRQTLNCLIEAAVNAERAQIAAGNVASVPASLLNRGWAGAGIWYNRIAEINGGLISAVNQLPEVARWPTTMQRVADIRIRNDSNPTPADMFNPNMNAVGAGVFLPRHGELSIARLYYDIYQQWAKDGAGTGARTQSGNTFENMITMIFGVDGLYSMTQNTLRPGETAVVNGQVEVHPLAKLTGLGKSLIDGSIRNLSLGMGGMLSDITVGMVDVSTAFSDAVGQAGVALTSAASITLTAGFILFYVVPMLPFIYYFFAVGTWIKTVFEAMVGVPLWAMAHLHIEGGGLPGQKAANGYYLLFEIFVRPVMIVMAFIAAVTIFAAMANVLIDIWDVAVANVGGSSSVEEQTLTEKIRTPCDKIFDLVMFTVRLDMIGVSSFKLVDQIPQSILRWIGASVPTFVDQKEDITSSIVSRTAMAANRIFGQFTQGITNKYEQKSKQQDIEYLQAKKEYHLKRDEEVPADVQRLRNIHADQWKAIEQKAAQTELNRYADAIRNGQGLPPEIKELADRFPRITKGIKDAKDK